MRKITIPVFFLCCLLWFSCGNAPQRSQQVIQSADDLRNVTVGVLMGSVQDKFISDSFPEAKVMRLENLADVFAALSRGMCDAALSDYSGYLEACEANDGLTLAIGNLWGASPCGFAFNKSNPDLRMQFDRFLQDTKDSGLFDEIYDRWFDHYTKDAAIPALPEVTSNNKLVFGVGGVMPRYAYIKDGLWQGFDMELASRFAASINCHLEVSNITFSGLIAALAVKKVDMIGGCICITKERAQQVDFSAPTTYEPCVVTVRKENALIQTGKPDWESFIEGKNVGVLLGSTQDIYITDHADKSTIFRLKEHADLAQSLYSAQCDVIVETAVIGGFLVHAKPQFTIYPDTIYTDSLGVCFRLEDTLLCKQFNTFLRQAKKEGVLKDMAQRWLTPGQLGERLSFDLPSEGEPLRVAVRQELMGFSYIKNNEFVGFEPEMIERFAAWMHRPVVYESLDFQSLIPSLMSNKVDMIASTITITPERAKKVLFSTPYYSIDIVPIYKKDVVQAKTSFFQGIIDAFQNNVIAEKRYMLIVEGLYETLLISLFSILLGTVLGCIICYLRMRKNTLIRSIAMVYISLMRGIPMLVLLMIMFYVVFASSGISPTTVAIITFSMNFAAYVSEMFRTSIEGVDRGQSEAGVALGFTKVKTFIYIVAPQAFRQVMPVYKGEVISLVKGTSIVGFIAIHDLTKASDIIRSRTFDAFFPLILISIIYFILAWLCTKLLDFLFSKAIESK